MAAPEVTAAICLTVQKFSETSKIAVLYTRQWGRISVIAKGAYRPKSQFVGHLEPLSISECVIYKKPKEQVHLLSSCRATVPWLPLAESSARAGYAFALVEFLYRHTYEGQDEAMFDFSTEALTAFARLSEGDLQRQFWGFILGALDILGFRPELDQCGVCGKQPRNDQTVIFDAASGRILCRDCREERGERLHPHRFSGAALSELRRRQDAPILRESDPRLSADALNEIAAALEDFARYHLGGSRLKALDFVRRMEG